MASTDARAAVVASTTALTVALVACGLSATGTGAADITIASDDAAITNDATGGASAEGGVTTSKDAADDATQTSDASNAYDASNLLDASDASSTIPADLVPDFAWYLLSETSGTTAHDSTAHKYDVPLGSAVTWSNGAHFTGTTSGGIVSVGASFRVPPVTISAWLTPTARSDRTSNNYVIQPFPENAVSGDLAGQFGYGIGLNVWTDGTAGSAAGVEDVDDNITLPSGFIATHEYLLTVVIDTSTSVIYVNGNQAASHSTTLPGMPTAGASLRLGYHNEDNGYGTKRFYEGAMRDVRVWKRTLTSAEAASLFSMGPAATN